MSISSFLTGIHQSNCTLVQLVYYTIIITILMCDIQHKQQSKTSELKNGELP